MSPDKETRSSGILCGGRYVSLGVWSRWVSAVSKPRLRTIWDSLVFTKQVYIPAATAIVPNGGNYQ